MACKIILHTKTYDPETGKYVSVDKELMTIDKNDVINTDQVAEYLAQLPKADREVLAKQLSLATYTTLTSTMVKKHAFVSNCTPGELVSRFNLPKSENIGSVDTDENYTIVVVDNPASINGLKMFGRVTTSDGREMFIINSAQEALKFLHYVKAKRNINRTFGKGQTPGAKYNEYLADLDAIVAHKGKSATRESVILDYLDNKDAYKPFKVGDKVVNSRYTLNMITRLLAGQDTYEPNRTSLELSLDQESEKKTVQVGRSEIQSWNISKKRLYEILCMHMSDLPSALTLEQFMDMTKDEMQTLLYGNNGLFIGHAKLERGEVGKVTTGNKASVRIEFPYRTIGEIAYGQKFLYSPVDGEEGIKDGMYHGFYIYKGVRDNGRTVYAISPSIISSQSYMWTESSPKAAKKEVDYLRSKRIIKLNSLLAIKQKTGNVRRSIIEQEGVRAGQVLSVLEIEGFPQRSITLDDLPLVMSGLGNLTVVDFQKTLNAVPGISKIDTTEKAAAFLVMAYQRLYIDAEKPIPDTLPKFIQDLINNKDLQRLVINPIANAKHKHYHIKKLPTSSKEEGTTQSKKTKSANPEEKKINYRAATLVWLNNNGEDLDPTGKYVGLDSNGKPQAKEKFLQQTLTSAVDYFKKRYKIPIRCCSQEDLRKLNIQAVNDKIDSVKGFIYKGTIYINLSTASETDLYHEVFHIFLGVLKASSPEGYTALMDHYRGTKSSHRADSFERMLELVRKLYPKFALSDLEEEAVVRLLANDMDNNGELPRIETENGNSTAGFNAGTFETLLNEILQKIEGLQGSVEAGDNGLGFTKWADSLMNNTGYRDKAQIQRIISRIIHQKIESQDVIPSPEC